MFYSFSVMPRYFDRADNLESKPYWCVVAQYESGDREIDDFPQGCDFLTGTNMEFLTMTEAKLKAEELEMKVFLKETSVGMANNS